MNRYRDLREEKDLSQQKVADALNIKRARYTHYENERVDVSTDILCKLADLYEVSTDYLLYNTDERTPHKIIKRKSKNRLKQIRREKKLRQIDVIDNLHIKQNCYSDYETGRLDIPTTTLKKISKIYDTSIDYILYRTDDNKKYKESIINENDK